jgi:rubrerythrin
VIELSIVFSAGEVIHIAIGIEKRGITFYDIMARSTDDAQAREVFEGLVGMEREHLKTFQGMRGEVGGQPPPAASGQEYSGYFQALVDNAVFTEDMIASGTAADESDIQALDLAIGAEKDSILFYYEMKDIIPRRFVPLVERIITEEKSHFQQLSEIKKKIRGS